MSKLIIVLAIVCASFALKINHQQGIPGGISQSKVNTEVDNYIREKLPNLKNAKLVKTQSQVVAGINYYYNYEINNTLWKVVVFDQEWTKTRSISSVVKVVETTESGVTKKVQTSISSDSRPLVDIVNSQLAN